VVDPVLNAFAALLVALNALVSAGAVEAPPRVALVELRTDDPVLAAEELRRLVTVVPGEPLSDLAVRQTLRNLQVTGAAAEVAVFTRPAEAVEVGRLVLRPDEPAPVVVVVVLWAALQVEEVALVGELGLARRLLESEIRVQRGQPLLADHVLRSVYALQELYERRGYLNARVRPEIDRDPGRQRVKVTFEVVSGPVTRVATVGFNGALGPFPPEKLADRLTLDPGDALRRDALRDDRDRLTRWLIREGHTRAQVGEVVETPHGESEVDLLWPVDVGPKLDFVVRGATRKELERARLLPFLELGYDEALLAQAEARIVRHLQAKGHWQAAAHFRTEPGAVGEERLVLEVEPGEVFTIESVEFTGVHSVPVAELEQRMATKARSLVRPGSGRLVNSQLAEDLENLRSFYRLQGFPEVVVARPKIAVEGTALAIEVPIDEGTRRVTVGEVTFEGVSARRVEDVQKDLGLPHPDNPGFHPLELEDALARLRQRYEDEGFLSAQVSAEETWNEAETQVDLRIRVIEGPVTTVDRVIVRGNVETRREVIEDALGLSPGQAISPRTIDEIERRLYRLGIFRRVDVELAPSGEPGEVDRDVLVRVEEGQSLRIAFGPGWDSESEWRVGTIVTQPNLFGRAWSLRADARTNFSAEHLARVRLRQPNFRFKLPFSYELAYEEDDRGDDGTVRREIARVQTVWGFGAEREVALTTGRRHQLGLALDYRVVDSRFRLAKPEDRQFLETEIASLVPSLVLDFRDDPIDPRAGGILSTQLQEAFPLSGLTEAEFSKVSILGGFHWPLGAGRQTLSLGLRLGGIEPHGGQVVPASERFIAGGAYTHRAFSFEGSDPLLVFEDCGDDVECRFAGGNGLALVNLDYRFPIFGALSVALFVDSGNVWADWHDIDFGDFATGVGLELAYSSPLGPLRAGYGRKLDARDDQPGYQWYFAIGYPF
jgi:outer membrane protein assembly complex protein YaeT